MVDIRLRRSDIDLDEPFVIEGLPGVGLVGKIATDHLVSEFGMEPYADVVGESLPPVAVFEDDDPAVKAPIRLFVDETRDVLALRGDVPVSAIQTPAFAEELTDWFADRECTPIFLSGLPASRNPDERPPLFGVATGDATARLERADVGAPTQDGMVSGPAGALLSHAQRSHLDSVGLIVETDPRFPDPQGARVLLEDGIAPIADLEVDTSPLVDRAEEIIDAREELAQRMQQANQHESSQAEHLGMYV